MHVEPVEHDRRTAVDLKIAMPHHVVHRVFRVEQVGVAAPASINSLAIFVHPVISGIPGPRGGGKAFQMRGAEISSSSSDDVVVEERAVVAHPERPVDFDSEAESLKDTMVNADGSFMDAAIDINTIAVVIVP